MTNQKNVFDRSFNFFMHEKECEDIIARFISLDELKSKKILDAGCRTGDFEKIFLKWGSIPYGIDINPLCIDEAKKYNPEIASNFFVSDVCDLSKFADNCFDFVFCIGVMPYIAKDSVPKAIKELLRVTKEEGSLFVVFQKNKPFFFSLFVKMINLIPLGLYLKIFAPFLCFVFMPFASLLFKKKVSYDFLMYLVFFNLYGLVNFGYPVEYEKYIISNFNSVGSPFPASETILIVKNQFENNKKSNEDNVS